MSLWVDEQLERRVERLDIEFNQFGYDAFGVSKRALVKAYSPFARIYRSYLSVSTFGMHHLPAKGRALLIGNHSGGIGADAAMVPTSTLLNETQPRLTHGMADYFFQKWPFVSPLLSRIGALTGLPEHAQLLMEAERLVLAFPEGARGPAKLYRDAYRLVRFGTGFMRLALEMKAPIVPFAFIGGEETFPTLFHLRRLARLTGVPHIPIAPQLVMWPFPVSCQIHWGEPMLFKGTGHESDETVSRYVGQVRDVIAGLIAEGRRARGFAFRTSRLVSADDPTS